MVAHPPRCGLLGDDLVKIDPRWNIYPPARTHNSSDYLIKHYQNQHIDWTRPFAIHYTGTEKPWMSKDCMFYENFWKYAEMTSIYTQMLAEFKSCSIERIPLFT